MFIEGLMMTYMRIWQSKIKNFSSMKWNFLKYNLKTNNYFLKKIKKK